MKKDRNPNFQLAFVILLLTMFFGCQNSLSEKKGEGSSSMEEVPANIQITGYGGTPIFIQPLDTLMSLNMAGGKASIFIEFIDEEYCNILMYSDAGNVQADRRYKLIEDKMVFISATGEEKEYSATENKLGVYITSKEGIKWRLISPGNSDYDNLNTKNSMKKNAFLYPVLTEKERQFGAEDRYVYGENDRLIMKSHPLRRKARQRSFLDQF